jgi:putative tryptophan/tyrosine transport system substrate-binding protein
VSREAGSHREIAMIKTIVGFILGSILWALCGPAEAQRQSDVARIGWIGTRLSSGPRSGAEAIRRALSELGYVEGKNIAFEYRAYESKLDRLPVVAEELVHLKVDLILASSTPAARAAKKATTTIPIVFFSHADPVVAGLVESFGRPGGNVTGFTSISPLIVGKRLELLKEIVPGLSRVIILWTRGQSEQSWKQSQLAAQQLSLHTHSMEVSNAGQFDSAFKEATKGGSAALAVTPTPVANSNRKLIAKLAAKYRLPAIYPDRRWTDAGGMLSYSGNAAERYRRIALIADKILKGANPGDLPVELPTKFELVINLKTAQALGLKIPAHLLMEADKVIE